MNWSKPIKKKNDTWSQKYDTGRNWDENVGEAVFMKDTTTQEVDVDDFDLKGTAIEEKYEVGHKIGRGTFSIVKRGKNKQTGEEVAIKILNEDLAPAFTLKELALQMDHLKGLEHPHIVKYLESFEIKNSICAVLSLQKGGEAIKKYSANPKGKWNEAIAQRIIKQLLEAVKYLHHNNVIHLHLTHENFLLKEDNEDSDVILGGFVLSKKKLEIILQ